MDKATLRMLQTVKNPIQTKRIEMADKRKGKGIFYFSGSKAGRISWADWFYIREKRK
jgi:hypothetical protein